MIQYWEIIDSNTVSDRWWLDDPETANGVKLDARLFTEGRKYYGQTTYPGPQSQESLLTEGVHYGANFPMQIPVYRGNKPLSFTLGPFEVPVVTERIAEHLQACCGNDIQLIPARVGGKDRCFEILNVLKIVEAIDEAHSEISWRIRKDSMGNSIKTYAGIAQLTLKKEKIEGASICRLKNWEMALIVSEKVKNVLQSLDSNGIGFKELKAV